jgi:hypothetical protein
VEALSVVEKSRIEVLEDKVKTGLRTFYEVGSALMEIREGRLYRAKYKTFEEYCREKWDIVASRARQLIASAETYENIKSVTKVTPLTERQTRPLVSLTPGEQREVWGRVIESTPPEEITARVVEREIERLFPPISKVVEEKPKVEEKRPKRVDLYENIRSGPKLISEEFKAAYDVIRTVLFNEKETGWKTTSKDLAADYIYGLLNMTK